MNIRALPAPLHWRLPAYPRLVEIGALAILFAVALYFYGRGVSMQDALDWWKADLDNLYGGSMLDAGGYVYPPPLAQVMSPAQLMPFAVFGSIVVAVNFGIGMYLVGPWLVALFLVGQFQPVVDELLWAPFNLALGAAAWYGFRHPWLWTLPLLTKVTPGIGILWFAARGEWRNLAWATVPAAVIAAISFAIGPDLWVQWVTWGMASAGAANANHVVPLIVRLPVAAGVVVWGARRDQPWAVLIAAALAHTTLAWAIAAPALGYAIGRLDNPLGKLRDRRQPADES